MTGRALRLVLLLAFALVAMQPHALVDGAQASADRRRRLATLAGTHAPLASRPAVRATPVPATVATATWRLPAPPNGVDTSPDVRPAQNLTLSPAVRPRSPRAPPFIP